MNDLTRRGFVKFSSMVGAVLAGAVTGKLEAQASGFQAASLPGGPGGPGGRAKKGPGIQGIYALCEVTGGVKKFTVLQYSTTWRSIPPAWRLTHTPQASSLLPEA